MASSYERLTTHRPRLLLITPDFPPAPGGIQVMAHRLALQMHGFETLTVALEGPAGAQFDRESALRVHRVGLRGAPRAARNALLDLSALRTALSFRPHVTLNLHMISSPAAVIIRHALGAPSVQYFHAKEIPARPKLAAFAAEHADAVIAVSKYTASLIRAAGATPRNLHLIPPGVDIPDAVSPERQDRPTIVTIARLEDRYKGHDVMVRALALIRARVPDVQWVVVGDGSLRAEIEARVRSEGVGAAVRFEGAVADRERDLWLRRADLLAMPSRLPDGAQAGEGFGIAYLEAGAYGKPVLAGDVGGALDSVSDGESGLLVDPRDPHAVAEAIVRLLLDRDLAERLGRAGAARAREFAWPAIAARVERLLSEQLRPARA
jgi:phosphatidyl-myo-inositol dimannoside synthase